MNRRKLAWGLFTTSLLFALLGTAESTLFQLLFQVHGATFGFLPGLLLGLGIGLATLLFGKSVGIWTGVIAGSLGNFYCVATLAHPLPVDFVLGSLTLRLPAFVILLGGVVGALLPMLLEKMELLEHAPRQEPGALTQEKPHEH